MGWGLHKADREALLGRSVRRPHTKKNAAAATTAITKAAAAARVTVIADLNAKIRQKAVDVKGGGRLSLHTIVRNAVMDMARVPDADHLVAVYDSPQSMPEMRADLWRSRYAKPPAAAPADDVSAALAHLRCAAASNTAARVCSPASFATLFTPGVLKSAAWAAIAAITRRVGSALHAAGKIPDFTLVASDHTFFTTTTSPAVAAALTTLAREAIGEADLKIYRLAQLLGTPLSGGTVLKTVDTDVILQTMATPCPPAGRRLELSLKDFEVDGAAMLDDFGGAANVALRFETAFWWIMAGGTDYSKPASDQGYAKRALLDLTHRENALRGLPVFTAEIEIEEEEPRFRFRFHPAAALKKLQSLPKTRKVARDVAGKAKKSGRTLSEAVRQAVMCTAYYGLLTTRPAKATFATGIVMSPGAAPVPLI